MRIFKHLLMVAILASSTQAVAQESDYTTSDVIGMFANRGAEPGDRAGEKTMSEAHMFCMSVIPAGFEKTESYDTDYYNYYRDCMAEFVPFKLAGADQAGVCGSQSVTWGSCQATLPDVVEGTTYSAANTFDVESFEGFANFQCSGGQWTYLSGGCSAAVQSCEPDLIVDWPVTAPAWADESAATTFTDRFGVKRHTPKGRCYARMPGVLSGKLLMPSATPNEMLEPENYAISSSVSAQRCFNGEWLAEPASRSDVCEYIPKSCPPMEYTHPSGCGYSIPAGSHDEVYTSNSPTPQNSVGGVTAHCWDGKWEIKSSSCQKSCAPEIAAYKWSSPVQGLNRMCGHSVFGDGNRLPPGTDFILDNETAGLDGSATYSCDNGTVTRTSQSCQPQSCDGPLAASWAGNNGAMCSHEDIGGTLAHGTRLTEVNDDALLNVVGERVYSCQYGELKVLGQICGQKENTVDICIAEGVDPDENSNPGYDPGDINVCMRQGAVYTNGGCCYTTRTGERRCYAVP